MSGNVFPCTKHFDIRICVPMFCLKSNLHIYIYIYNVQECYKVIKLEGCGLHTKNISKNGWPDRGSWNQCALPGKPGGPLGPIYPHVARRCPRLVSVAVASPYLNFICLNFIFSSCRLSSDELSLKFRFVSWEQGPSRLNVVKLLFFHDLFDLIFC